MPSDSEIHKNDVGTVFTITIKDSGTAVDVSSANTTTSRIILLKDPDGNVHTNTASFSGSGTAGILLFTTTTGLIDTAGTWEIQAKITLATATSVFYTDVQEFNVYENLE